MQVTKNSSLQSMNEETSWQMCLLTPVLVALTERVTGIFDEVYAKHTLELLEKDSIAMD